jgi:hypothetical protein
MRIFETYPPSTVLAAVVGGVMIICGLELAFWFFVGCAVMAVGYALDRYGLPK